MDIQQIDKISNKNIGQLMELLDALNCSEPVKKTVKAFYWKTNDEIKEFIARGE